MEDVVVFYNKGGGKNSNLDPAMQRLGLSETEQQDLVAFMKTLSGRIPAIIPPEFK
ncbi:MAG: hypothetical protein HY349_05145 [Nitrospirae bacterium]|nr:hypothetical protein [Nitrospirota bacterium]